MKKMNDIPDKNPFKVPENYFEEVNRKIISATSGSEKEVRKIGVYGRLRTNLLIAASITGFILITYTSVRLLTPDKINTPVSVVLHDINPDTYLNEIDITSLEENASALLPEAAGPDVSKKDIIDYLLFENVEIAEIYEQL